MLWGVYNSIGLWFDHVQRALSIYSISQSPEPIKKVRNYISFSLILHWAFLLGYSALTMGIESIEHLFYQLYHARGILKNLPLIFVGSFIAHVGIQSGYRIWKAINTPAPFAYKTKEVFFAASKFLLASLTLLGPYLFVEYTAFSLVANAYIANLVCDELGKMVYQCYERLFITKRQIDWSYVASSIYTYGTILAFLAMLTFNFINPASLAFSMGLSISAGAYMLFDVIVSTRIGKQQADELDVYQLDSQKAQLNKTISKWTVLKFSLGLLQVGFGLYLSVFGFVGPVMDTLEIALYCTTLSSLFAFGDLNRASRLQTRMDEIKHAQHSSEHQASSSYEYLVENYQEQIVIKQNYLPAPLSRSSAVNESSRLIDSSVVGRLVEAVGFHSRSSEQKSAIPEQNQENTTFSSLVI